MVSKISPLFLVVILFFGIGSGCGGEDDPNPGGTDGCVRASDCPDGQRCNGAGECTADSQSCSFSSDCGVDEYCAAGTCAPSACSDDDGCVDGFICDGDTCSAGCRVAEDCPDGQTCSPSNLCEQAGCITGMCPNFQTCDNNQDPPACQYNGDCESDIQCVLYGDQLGDGEEYICSTAQQRCVVKPPCGGDQDCPSNQICEERQSDQKLVCRAGCRENGDCVAGRICDQNSLLCVRGCSGDADCDPVGGVDYACVDLLCVPTCDTRDDCMVAGQVCNGGPATCKGCTSDSQCPASELCDFTRGATPAEEMNPIIGLCTTRPPACPDDGFGDNHTQNTPFALDTFPYETPVGAPPSLCRDKPAGEWFQFDVESGKVIEVELLYSNADGNMDLGLRRQGGDEVAQSSKPPTSEGDNGREFIRYGVALGGPFQVQVRGALVGQNAPYVLKVNVIDPPACTDDVLEPNEQASPAALPVSMDYTGLQVCGDDPDFYELSVAQNQVVTIIAEAPVNLGNVDLFLRDDQGTQIASATTTMDVERIDVEIEQAGAYTLEVRVAGAVGVVDYDLIWRQNDNNCADAFEPNDTCPGAEAATGLHEDLNLCSDGDWYQIELTPLQTLTVTATYDRSVSAGDLDISLFGPNDCATLISTGTETSTGMGSEVQEQVVYQAQQGGVFHLQTFLFSGVQATYDLDIAIVDGPPCDDDMSEPNNDQASAGVIDRTMANQGTDNIITGLKLCDDDSDYFAIDLVEGDVLEWQVSFQHALGDVDAELINSAGLVLQVGDSTDDNETVGHTVLAGEAGRYYLRVFGKFATRTDYWVLTTLNGMGPPDPVCPDIFENNDDRANAVSLNVGSYGLLVCGNPQDDDWFKTMLNPGDTITVETSFQHAAGDISLFIFDDSGSTSPVASSISGNDTETVTYTSARQQEVFYQVRTASNVVNQTYNLDVAITPGAACAGDDLDPNDSAAAAADVPAPGLTGRLTLCENTEDWFKLSLEAGQAAEVFLNFNGSGANIDLEVYEADGTTLVGSGTTNTSDESVTFTPATTGDYLVRVFSPVPTRLDYDLLAYVDTDGDMVLEGPEDRACPDFAENNDTQNAAARLPTGTYDELLLCWEIGLTDLDWYAVFVPAGATLTARIDFSHAAGDIQLSVSQGAVLDSSETTDDFEEVTVTNSGMVGADYFVRVYGAAAGFSSYYSLDIDLSFANACTDDTNAGGTEATAVAQTTGTFANNLCEGTDDWIELPSSATSVVANIELKNRFGNIDMELLVDGSVVASSATDNNVESLDISGLGAGAKHLRIFARDGSFFRNLYDLWLSVDGAQPTTPFCEDDHERNDDMSSAESVSVFGAPWHTGFFACGVEDDWLEIRDLFGGTAHEIGVFYDHSATSDVTLRITDPAGTVLTTVDTAENDALTQFIPPSNGNYFVQVSGLGNDAVDYDLLIGPGSIYSTLGCSEDSNEPNDNSAQLATLSVPFDGGASVCGNDDYFSFTPTTSGPIDVVLKSDDSKMNLTFNVIEHLTGQNVVSTGGTATTALNRKSISFMATAGTQYRIEILRGVNGMGAVSTGPYFLSIE